MIGGKMMVQGPAFLALHWKNIFIIRIMNPDPAFEAKGWLDGWFLYNRAQP
jgi:hypothetical protein